MARQLLTAAAVGSGLFRYLELGLVCTGENRLLDAVVVVFAASAQHEYDLL